MGRTINIRPTTSVYATYKNINYQVWTAIAEFVDNSTQSYFDNKKRLSESKYWAGLKVEITYKRDEYNNFFLEVRDNAYGMEYKDFERAIILDSKPSNPTRNEFGMGLKTAACWFGLKWSVESTALGSDVKYYTEVDVEHLSKYKNEEIEVEETSCSPKEHGTIIKIWNLNRTIQGRQIGKTKSMLSGMYRDDLRTSSIRILYNDEELFFEEPDVYEETLNDGSIHKWIQNDIDFYIEHNEKKYRVYGYIGIRKKASTKEAGYALIRRGRVIIGGFENNFRPFEIFGNSNSFEYQRVFGELHMDDWPVIQTKDNFDWNNGLEDKFIDELKKISSEIVKKAKTVRVRKSIDIPKTIEKTVKFFEKAGIISDVSISDYICDIENDSSTSIINYEEIVDNDEVLGDEENNDALLFCNSPKTISFILLERSYIFNLSIEENSPNEKWLNISKKRTDYEYDIVWNIKHPFFRKMTDNPEFISMMQSFIFALAISEVESRAISNGGMIDSSSIRLKMNEILKTLSEGDGKFE